MPSPPAPHTATPPTPMGSPKHLNELADLCAWPFFFLSPCGRAFSKLLLLIPVLSPSLLDLDCNSSPLVVSACFYYRCVVPCFLCLPLHGALSSSSSLSFSLPFLPTLRTPLLVLLLSWVLLCPCIRLFLWAWPLLQLLPLPI